MLLRRLFSVLLISAGLCQIQGAIIEGPSTTVALPGQDVEFTCNASSQPFWRVNGISYTLGQLFIGMPPGHNVSGTNIVVTDIVLGDSRNGSEYRCVVDQLPPNPEIMSDPAFLYVAAPPDMPVIVVELASVVVVNADILNPTVNFTLSWTVPIANFDPIQNYTITIDCTAVSGCPVTLTADGNATSIGVSYTASMVNATIMVTANNNVGASNASVLEVATPGTVQNVSVSCSPMDLENQCTVNWDLLSYGPNAVQAPIQYSAEISGANITSRMMNTDTSTVTFSGLPAVDSNIFVTVLASNMFGQGTRSNQVMTEIMSPSVRATTSEVLGGDTPADIYNIEVVCDIDPSSTADYCEVIARNNNSTVSASASIDENDMATVTVSSLICGETYSILAGGIFTDQMLDGPRFHMETVTASACPVIQTTVISITTTTPVFTTMTPTSTVIPTDDGDDDDSNVGAIVGGVIGGIAAAILIIVLIIVIYICCIRNRDSGSRAISPNADKQPVTSGRPTSVRVQTLDRYGKPMDNTDGGNVELTDYKPVGSPEYTVTQVPSNNNQLNTKEEARTPSTYVPEGSYDTLAPADEPQTQNAPSSTQNGQDQRGKLNYAELEQFTRKPASVKKPDAQPPSQYAVIDPKSLQGTYT